MTKISLSGEGWVCNICKQIKPESDFYKDTKRKRYTCRRCASKVSNDFIIKKFGSFRNANLYRKYGIFQEDYDRIYEEQKGLCLICERERNLVVDHSHKTGKIRGLLCSGCNTGIGQFEHDTTLFDKAKEYVS